MEQQSLSASIRPERVWSPPSPPRISMQQRSAAAPGEGGSASERVSEERAGERALGRGRNRLQAA